MFFSDPFRMGNSQALVQFLSEKNPGGCKTFTIGIEYLYYTMPHEGLLKCFNDCINEQVQETVFPDKCGIATGAFVEIITMYLKSTLVGWKEGIYVQKPGICIGSKVARFLVIYTLARLTNV